MAPTAQRQDTCNPPRLYMSLELGSTKWVVTTAVSPRRLRQNTIPAGDRPALRRALQREVSRAKSRFGLAEDAQVRCCYEAGRDAFWVHRMLAQEGYDNDVVDSASIQVDRRKRRVKGDRVDGRKLLQQLMKYDEGDKDALRVARVPSEEDEDLRRVHRGRERLKKERTSLKNRIRGLLCTQGVRLGSFRGRNLRQGLAKLRRWDGEPLERHLLSELERDCDRLSLVEEQLGQVEAERRALLDGGESVTALKAAFLMTLVGVGETSAWVLAAELFGWREFHNRREVGAAAGLVGTPYNSDQSEREQGISKAGNKHVRTMMVELAWSWLRNQPQSKLSEWFDQRYAPGSKRLRRIGIVALARRLLIELWRYVETGVAPAGARIKMTQTAA